ncbi:hypothetical protein Tco_1402142 [Tanacetum coccineum]
MMMVVCYDDGEDGGGGSGVVEVARGASGVVDRVDRSDGESFGLRRKNPPEKFSGGGGGRRLPDMGGREESETIREIDIEFKAVNEYLVRVNKVKISMNESA